MLTQEDAEAIAKKLECVPHEGRKHKFFELFVGQRLIIRFGVSRASKEKGHGHLPRQLHITQKECHRLLDCDLTKAGYLEVLKEKGFLAPEPSPGS